MSQATAATTIGSSTPGSAVPATQQGPAPSTAAPTAAQPSNTPMATASKTKKSFAPRKTFAEAPATVPAGVSQMLTGVATLPLHDVRFDTPTYKVPCFIQFYYVLALMDEQMVTTKRFTDANADWMPYVSQLYFAVLLYYQTLRCQKIGAQISPDQTLFLEFLETNYPGIQFAKIPGPLVPFFQALAANAGPTPAYGNVVFGIPNNVQVTQGQQFMYANRLNAHLPNIIAILDQMCRYIQRFAPAVPAAAGPIVANMSYADYFNSDFFGIAAAAGNASAIVMLSPSMRNEVSMTVNIASSFLGSSNNWRNCLPFDPATNQSTYLAGAGAANLTFAQIMGFRGHGATALTNFNWFGQVGRIMQPYADFFRDSVSLGAITTSGIGINYIITRLSSTAADVATLTGAPAVRNVRYMPAGTARYAVQPAGNLQTYHQHCEEQLDLISEQMGLLTQLDVDWTLPNGAIAAAHPGPLRGNTTSGPLDARIITRTTDYIFVAPTLPPIISGYFHTPSASSFN